VYCIKGKTANSSISTTHSGLTAVLREKPSNIYYLLQIIYIAEN